MKVLYVMGMGRSGSTLLDILIGSHSDAVGTGELANLVSRGWSHGDRCACGMDATVCSFWSAVREQWVSEVGSDPTAEYERLQESAERTRRLPWIGSRPTPDDPVVNRYGVLTTALFHAIERVSGKTVIVDSSKSPARALALSRLPGVDAFVVHLVRDSRAVAWSFAKHFDQDPTAGIQLEQPGFAGWRSALRWDLINTQSEWVRTQLPRGRSIRVRYEDLMDDPRGTIERIGALVGLDLSGLGEAVGAGARVPISHPVSGNRLRMDGSVQLLADEAWVGLMPHGEQTKVKVLTWPFMRRYGYR
jgi:hypothetical protein